MKPAGRRFLQICDTAMAWIGCPLFPLASFPLTPVATSLKHAVTTASRVIKVTRRNAVAFSDSLHSLF